jgi:hypothetical protein
MLNLRGFKKEPETYLDAFNRLPNQARYQSHLLPHICLQKRGFAI